MTTLDNLRKREKAKHNMTIRAKRRSDQLELRPRWQKVAMVVVVGVVVIGVLAPDPEDAEGDETTAAQGTSVTSTTEATTTTSAPTTTTTVPTTTTTRATTTTTVEITEEAAAALFVLTFEASRQSIIDIWTDDVNVESVDGFVVETDEPGNVATTFVVLDVTSGWAAEENQHDGAWEITRAMAILWHPEDGPWYNEIWQPPFRLVNSGRTYQCPAEFMVSLADARASRSEWEETCA